MEPFIITNGGEFDFNRPQEFDIKDIALALSNTCRFGGHIKKHYSVAQHCVYLSHMVPPEDMLAGLLHDAHKAYVGEMVLPLKSLIPEYVKLEGWVATALREYFGLSGDSPDSVSRANLQLLAAEQRDLLGDRGRGWEILRGVTLIPWQVVPWTADEARIAFLQRWSSRWRL